MATNDFKSCFNGHSSPLKFVFYLYVMVLLGTGFCLELMPLCWIPVNVTCIIVILGTL